MCSVCDEHCGLVLYNQFVEGIYIKVSTLHWEGKQQRNVARILQQINNYNKAMNHRYVRHETLH
jgi:hypothetical protein